MKVAALFVDPCGVYSALQDVDLWPESRDARLYAGPYPVVAHPPCNRWCRMATLNYRLYPREDNRVGNDGGCFASALASVRSWGGVLEHPASTLAWAAHDLSPPRGLGWQQTLDVGWVCEVWQSAYGHLAAKATWLYYVGELAPMPLDWSRLPGSAIVGYVLAKYRTRPTLPRRLTSATPPQFRDVLLQLARMSRGVI